MCSLSKDLEMFSEYWKCSYLGSFQALKSVILMIWLWEASTKLGSKSRIQLYMGQDWTTWS